MKIVIVALPVSAFEIMVLDNSKTVETTSAFYCSVVSCLQKLMDKYNIKNIHLVGPENYVSQIAEELKEIFSVSITY